MRTAAALVFSLGIVGSSAAFSAEVSLHVRDREGAAARVAAPVSLPIELTEVLGEDAPTRAWHLAAIDGSEESQGQSRLVPAQFEPESPGARRGTLWWIMPPGRQGQRRFRLTLLEEKPSPAWDVRHDKTGQWIEVAERTDQRVPVLRYNHGPVPVREGTHPHFAPGESYERGDYVHPLFGPHGEELTEDYPRDHPHHRGVWWSWPVTRWKDQVADIWAVVGVWARPVAVRRIQAGPVFALLEAENVWEFGKSEVPIVREEVLIRAFRQTGRCRFIDVELRLTALADDVAIGGRPKAGYGGFALRTAPCQGRRITPFTDPEGTIPRRCWIDYSGVFSPATETAGVTIFEHVSNPDYPNPLHEYPQCNCVMPAYPDQREVPLSKHEPLVLKHRLWIHTGGPEEQKLADVWASYAEPPQVTIEP